MIQFKNILGWRFWKKNNRHKNRFKWNIFYCNVACSSEEKEKKQRINIEKRFKRNFHAPFNIKKKFVITSEISHFHGYSLWVFHHRILVIFYQPSKIACLQLSGCNVICFMSTLNSTIVNFLFKLNIFSSVNSIRCWVKSEKESINVANEIGRLEKAYISLENQAWMLTCKARYFNQFYIDFQWCQFDFNCVDWFAFSFHWFISISCCTLHLFDVYVFLLSNGR